MKITIIGAGNIGTSLATGILRDGYIKPENITITDISENALFPFEKLGVKTMQNNIEAVKNADAIVLCVKKNMVSRIVDDIKLSYKTETPLISVAADLKLHELESYTTGVKAHLFRAIPNTAMSVCQSMTCVAAHYKAGVAQQKKVVELFGRVGKVMFLPESLMNSATVVASCGTAFALRYMRAMTTAGVETGLSPALAETLITQTLLGAATILSESGNNPESEIDRVTTPNGVTIKGLNEMEHAGFSSAVIKGIMAAYRKLELNEVENMGFNPAVIKGILAAYR